MSKKPEKKESLWDTLNEGLFNESLYTDWLTKYGKPLLISIACFVALLIIGLRFSMGSSSKSAADYFKAEKEFTAFQKGKGETQALASLEQILHNMPQLHAKYDGQIAQQLLLQNDVKEAQEFANLALQRTAKNNLPFYADYTRISLLTSQGDYKTALEKTLQLKAKMLEQPAPRSFGDTLFAYTLLNQALLNQQLGNSAAEKESWNEIKQYARLVKEAPPTDHFAPQAFVQMLAQFEMGKVSFRNL